MDAHSQQWSREELVDEIDRLRARVAELEGVVEAARSASQGMIDGYKSGGGDTYGSHAEGLCDGGCRVIDAMAAAEAAAKEASHD